MHRGGKIDDQTWAPEDVGLERCTLADIRGGSLEENVAVAQRVLELRAIPELRGAPLEPVDFHERELLADPLVGPRIEDAVDRYLPRGAHGCILGKFRLHCQGEQECEKYRPQ